MNRIERNKLTVCNAKRTEFVTIRGLALAVSCTIRVKLDGRGSKWTVDATLGPNRTVKGLLVILKYII